MECGPGQVRATASNTGRCASSWRSGASNRPTGGRSFRSAREGKGGEEGRMSFIGSVNILGLELQTPEALLLLLLLPLWWLWRRRNAPGAIVFSRTGVLARGPRAGRAIARAIFTLRNVALASMIIALARPRTGARVENITTSGINIVLAIDLSSSMLAEDFRPSNRLEVAKAKVKQFIIS